MIEVKTFRQKDLVLAVNPAIDPNVLDLDAWRPYLDCLCGDRTYQKEAIKAAVCYLASGQYTSLRQLAAENYANHSVLREKYATEAQFLDTLQLPDQLYGTIDLATGTGKSYVIFGIAQIMLSLGLVDQVLVLCPSLTIEAGLTEKFEALSGNASLKQWLPEDIQFSNPRIVNANETIRRGTSVWKTSMPSTPLPAPPFQTASKAKVPGP